MTAVATVTVRLPSVLATHVGGRRELVIAGATVGEVVGALAAGHPELQGRIVDGDGRVQPWLNVFVGTTDVRSRQGLTTSVQPGDVVTLVPAVAGG